MSGFVSGADAAAVSLVPVLLAVYLGEVPALLFAIQVVASAGAWVAGMAALSGRK
ncbi:hypothetical protein [Arthrobacter sp. H14]|uniref:hypothetical protein n=1 Tax=Arthrobacter sp. H14 TaxID=1312959 RepID=UPI0004B49D59|nr:hypothetical protein [Arthrobacter sp. H14]